MAQDGRSKRSAIMSDSKKLSYCRLIRLALVMKAFNWNRER
jgi:hypothetical protein